jgi:nicotinamide phosphoribosyltransferase
MTYNLILDTDSYKASHWLQYPAGTEQISSYIEARGGPYEEGIFFGLQAFLKRYLTTPFTQRDIDEAEAIFTAHGEPFNRHGWEHILHKHKGLLPIEIEALPEGTRFPMRCAVLQVVNTDPACAWLVPYIETALLRAVWYPSTVASHSAACKKVLKHYLQETADTLEKLPFMLHDFGGRGVSSLESAELGGLAHLVNFRGTDTVPALLAARRYYGENMAAFSIPAAEHSTVILWGREQETEAYQHIISRFLSHGKLVSVVSDSYDYWKAIDIWRGTLRDQIRASGGTLVIRPDSGEPCELIPETLTRLAEAFGAEVNSKGYRVLNPCVRLIQGDGVSLEKIGEILEVMKNTGWSADNIVFGMGGELLQKVHRDTMRWAMKPSAAKIGGNWREVFKNPATDPGKASKAGILAVVENAEGRLQTVKKNAGWYDRNLLQPVFRNGRLLSETRFAQVRLQTEASCRVG